MVFASTLSCHCFLFLPQSFGLWRHFIYVLISFLRASQLPQEVPKHLIANQMSLVLLWSKRQPRTPGFSLLGVTFFSGHLGHLAWKMTWLCICTCEDFTDWILCRPEGACYLAVPERSLLFLFTQCYYFSLWCLIYQHLSDRLLLIWKGRRKYALFKMFSKSLLNFSLNR